MLKALHTHDCYDCVLIGQKDDEDVYYCTGEGSVLIRSGSEGPEYASFPMSVARVVAQGAGRESWGYAVALAEAFNIGRTTLRMS